MRQIMKQYEKLSSVRPALLPVIIILFSARIITLRPTLFSLGLLLLLFVFLLLICGGLERPLLIFFTLLFITLNLYCHLDRTGQIARLSEGFQPGAGTYVLRLDRVTRRADKPYFEAEGVISLGRLKGLKAALQGPSEFARGLYPGQTAEVTAVPEPLTGARIPGEFSPAAYYAKKGIFLKLKCRKNTPLRVLPGKTSLISRIARLREKLTLVFTRSAGTEAGGFASAMLYGDKEYLSLKTEEEYRDFGLSHVLVTSGTHVSLCLSYFRPFIFRFVRRREIRLGLQASLLAILCVLSLGSPAILRACLMKALELADALFGRRCLKDNYLYASVLILIALRPRLALDQGFLMSAAATQAVYVVPPLDNRGTETGWRRYLKELGFKLSMYWRIQLFLLPLSGHFGQKYPLGHVLANLFLLPLTEILLSWALLHLFFVWLAPVTGWLGLALRSGAGFFSWLLEKGTPFNAISFTFSRYMLCLIPAFLLWLYIKVLKGRRRVFFWLAPAACLVILLLVSAFFKAREGIYFLDIGQGDATFIKDKNVCALVDAGPPGSGVRIASFLRYLEEDRIQYIFVTHLDRDHAGGVAELLREGIRADYVILPDAAKADERFPDFCGEIRGASPASEILLLKAGTDFRLPSLSFRVLGPDKVYKERNDNSFIFGVKARRFSLLLTGDAGFSPEEALLERGLPGHYDLLHVSHHGAANGTSAAFLEQVSPEAAIISCGKNNRYGHPAKALLKRIRHVRRILRTDRSGSFFIGMTGTSDKLGPASAERYLPRSYAKIMGTEADYGG